MIFNPGANKDKCPLAIYLQYPPMPISNMQSSLPLTNNIDTASSERNAQHECNATCTLVRALKTHIALGYLRYLPAHVPKHRHHVLICMLERCMVNLMRCPEPAGMCTRPKPQFIKSSYNESYGMLGCDSRNLPRRQQTMASCMVLRSSIAMKPTSSTQLSR